METHGEETKQRPVEPSARTSVGSGEVVIAVVSLCCWGSLLVLVARDRNPPASSANRWIILAFGLVFAIQLVVRSRRAASRELAGARPDVQAMWRSASSNVVWLLLAMVWLTVSLGCLAVILAAHGVALSADPAVVVAVGAVYRHLVWELLGAVPVVDLPDTLGWERPITDPAAALGLIALFLRSAFVLVVLGLMVRWLGPFRQAMTRPPTTGTGEAAREPSA